MNQIERNDLQTTISQVLHEMEVEAGEKFDISKVNLAELGRRTGISRKKLRNLRKNGFLVKPHALKGKKHEETKLTGFEGIIDHHLQSGNRNAEVIYEHLKAEGYTGKLTQVRVYIEDHLHLMPAKRQIVAPQGNRGRRYTTGPGESYQMDWGFVNVESSDGRTWRAACFAMICHHCGERFVEFFPNAKQENLFIGMIHAFQRMGIPQYVLTDNMKSVVNGRDSEGHPLWNGEYAAFMNAVGFETRLCKPRHPFTKGAVERLVQFVKGNFMAGRIFGTITDLNFEALSWCDRQNRVYHKAIDCVPHDEHLLRCMAVARSFELTEELRLYLWPERAISFDGFVSYEGRRFGVPYWYTAKTCRISRQEYSIYIYSTDLQRKLAEYSVTWSRKDQFCPDQYASEQPEEFPTTRIAVTMRQNISAHPENFSEFNFDREVQW
mgnify:FL=1